MSLSALLFIEFRSIRLNRRRDRGRVHLASPSVGLSRFVALVSLIFFPVLGLVRHHHSKVLAPKPRGGIADFNGAFQTTRERHTRRWHKLEYTYLDLRQTPFGRSA